LHRIQSIASYFLHDIFETQINADKLKKKINTDKSNSYLCLSFFNPSVFICVIDFKEFFGFYHTLKISLSFLKAG